MTKIIAETADLTLILEGEMHLGRTDLLQAWACRGVGKGCKRNTFRKTKKHCADCFGPLDPGLSLAQVKRMLDRGDA